MGHVYFHRGAHLRNEFIRQRNELENKFNIILLHLLVFTRSPEYYKNTLSELFFWNA